MVAERDELADVLHSHWPQMEASIVALLSKLAENDQKIGALHSRCPDSIGGESVKSAELVARDLERSRASNRRSSRCSCRRSLVTVPLGRHGSKQLRSSRP